MGMSGTTQSAFQVGRDEVERRVSDHEPFETIEEMIDRTDLSEDEKAALWLLAWNGQPKRVRIALVGGALTSVQG
jgi:hypothetical protein